MGKRHKDDWDRADSNSRATMICKALSGKGMDQERIDKLLSVVSSQDQVKLKILHNAVFKCARDYHNESTAQRLRDWNAAEEALKAYVDALWDQAFPTSPKEKQFTNLTAVLNYLKTNGWKVEKATIYKHQKAGRIRPGENGTYRLGDVDRYAETFLKRVDGSTSSNETEKIHLELKRAETDKMKAQAVHWDIKAKVASGMYVERSEFERALTMRAQVFKSDLVNFAHGHAPGIVGIVNGDPLKTPDLIEFLLNAFEDFLDRYASDEEFRVPVPMQAAVAKEEKINDDDEEEDEI